MRRKGLGNVFIEEYTKADKDKARFLGGPMVAEVMGLGFYLVELITWADWIDFYRNTYEGKNLYCKFNGDLTCSNDLTCSDCVIYWYGYYLDIGEV